MSIKENELIKFIEEIAPLSLQEDWDSSGLQFKSNKKNNDIEKIYVALDPTEKNLKDAASKNCDFILTHHPLFMNDEFESKENKTNKTIFIKKNVIKKDRNLTIYSSHTSFDSSTKGHNFLLPKALNDKGIINLLKESKKTGKKTSKKSNKENLFLYDINKIRLPKIKEKLIGTFFLIKEIEFEKFLKDLKKFFKTKTLPVVLGENNVNKKIKKIALCGGSGTYNIDKMNLNKIDLYITGDIKYHTALDYSKKRMPIFLDLTHFFSEILFCELMHQYITEKFKGKIEVVISKTEEQPIKYI